MAFEEVATGGSLIQTNKFENGQEFVGYLTGVSPNKFQATKNDLVMVTPEGRQTLVIVCGFLNKVAKEAGTDAFPMNALYRFIRDESQDYTEKKFKKLVRGFKIQVDRSEKYGQSLAKEVKEKTDENINGIPF